MDINNLDIKEFRKKNKITQESLADLLGVSWRTIQNYEAGQKIPKSKSALFRVVFEKYGVGKEELFMDVSKKDIVTLDEIALFAAKNIDELKKKSVFYNTFVMEALGLIKEIKNDDGSIDPLKLTSKD
ncbi:helix-turn-helix domain-containing protein [Tenacibaculum finnmarkense]|uniref:helix-turn-helix domain-containing protein n=1 Tax=Tenacibaculum finnmarkense TaxID=2781243 RepID=UPI001EFA9EEC|nr:helix-turn-helix transcriptional regulator [Tenacibaculum finnmarkense]MCG8207228.1 helix-turn-helix transcriptional regulator [Tenacibaculum finnmarkense genomovar finnmarkense]MCG8723298.1 helix-turn-helix transcriptional regulator [Tenacibaculum finnmarkense]MCG8741665.1 helix-turn-helix transcriptional regulator [Tenacibaculum finnmarkense]MCG8764962.1 helix-turn-helix transcriptional regulator [Tenacibaculum finnmarkense]MCG8777822.1 helix-turn-helix transcriptional regulator [Tenaciba